MEYVSGLFCAANYSCVRCACVDDLDETDDFDRLRAYAVSRLGAPPDSDDEGEASGCVTRVVNEPVDEAGVRPGLPARFRKARLARGEVRPREGIEALPQGLRRRGRLPPPRMGLAQKQ